MDKPYIESFIGSHKTEELYRHKYRGSTEPMTVFDTYRAWYREARLHQALAYRSPVEYAESAQRSILLLA